MAARRLIMFKEQLLTVMKEAISIINSKRTKYEHQAKRLHRQDKLMEYVIQPSN